MEQPPAYSPQAIADILPIYRPQDADGHIRVYKLRRTAADGQSLALLEHATTVYTIKARATGGFMNRKPHVVISEIDKTQVIAEGRFDNLGTGTTLTYINPPRILTLDLENSQVQRLKTTIGGQDHWWQPHPGNKGVLELTNETEEIVARFIHAAPVSAETGSVGSTKDAPTEMDVGELSVIEALSGTDTGLEETLCSAIVVIERARRRAANMAKTDKQGTGWAAGGFY
jgi:hypothetical protein